MSEHVETLATYLKLLGHPIRLQTVLLLLTQPRTVSELEQLLQVRQPNLSQHLAVLREAGILCSAREAKSVTYTIDPGLPQQLIAALAGLDNAAAPRTVTHAEPAPMVNLPAQQGGDELIFAKVRFPAERD